MSKYDEYRVWYFTKNCRWSAGDWTDYVHAVTQRHWFRKDKFCTALERRGEALKFAHGRLPI